MLLKKVKGIWDRLRFQNSSDWADQSGKKKVLLIFSGELVFVT